MVTKNINLINFLLSFFDKYMAIKPNNIAAMAGMIASFSIGKMAKIIAKIEDINPNIENSNFIII